MSAICNMVWTCSTISMLLPCEIKTLSCSLVFGVAGVAVCGRGIAATGEAVVPPAVSGGAVPILLQEAQPMAVRSDPTLYIPSTSPYQYPVASTDPFDR